MEGKYRLTKPREDALSGVFKILLMEGNSRLLLAKLALLCLEESCGGLRLMVGLCEALNDCWKSREGTKGIWFL